MQNEVGLVNNPLKISWLEGQPQSTVGHPGLSQVRSQAWPTSVDCGEEGDCRAVTLLSLFLSEDHPQT